MLKLLFGGLVGFWVFLYAGTELAADDGTSSKVDRRRARFAVIVLEADGKTALATRLQVLLDKKDEKAIRTWFRDHEGILQEAILHFFASKPDPIVEQVGDLSKKYRDEWVQRRQVIERNEREKQREAKREEAEEKRMAEEEQRREERRGGGSGRRGRGPEFEIRPDPNAEGKYAKFDYEFWEDKFERDQRSIRKNRSFLEQFGRDEKNRRRLYKKHGKPDRVDEIIDWIEERMRDYAAKGWGRR